MSSKGFQDLDLVSQDHTSGEGFRTTVFLYLVSLDLIGGEVFQDHWFPGLSVPGLDVM